MGDQHTRDSDGKGLKFNIFELIFIQTEVGATFQLYKFGRQILLLAVAHINVIIYHLCSFIKLIFVLHLIFTGGKQINNHSFITVVELITDHLQGF